MVGVITRVAKLELIPPGIFGVHDPTFAIVVAIARWDLHAPIVQHLADIDAPGGMPTEIVMLGRMSPSEAIDHGEILVTAGITELLVDWRRGLLEGAIERAWRGEVLYAWRRQVGAVDPATGFVTFTPMRVRCTECDGTYLVPQGTHLDGASCGCGRTGSLVAYQTDPAPRAAVPREIECPYCSWRFLQSAPTPDDVCPHCHRLVRAE